jgi:hypothetical protein
MVGHMSGDTTQRRTFKTTLRIGGLNGQQKNRSTD